MKPQWREKINEKKKSKPSKNRLWSICTIQLNENTEARGKKCTKIALVNTPTKKGIIPEKKPEW